ncbi:DNA-binding transcriptional regulator, MarR family [Thermanaeromonas toyohensis ToBE]|uniref:DNA-binding transcriptional regulator, MarR family n=1 Tax=Thermanaeromonas toyohensis ToBE TaxID=698762 RepID=A0A1W1VV82_9FIRM|nr:MarR family transcriptional regulator [Thermanaeromonas toyohensis]SMB97011.1 DNA-binding transcriptional regulator, MarR family [Thermanaeromonas toyohensis ToBE]
MQDELPVVRLHQLLAELARAMQLLEKSEVGCCGITLSQCHLLLEVSRRKEGETSLSELAAALGLDLSTVSRVADGLVRRGLLKREADPGDRRRLALFLTDTGRELVEVINRGMNEYVHRILRQIPAEKRQVVLEGLDLLVAAVKKLEGGCCQ